MIEKEYVEVTTAQAYVLLADFHAAYKNDPDVHPVVDYLMDVLLASMIVNHASPDDAAIKANVNIADLNKHAEWAYKRVGPDAYQNQQEPSSVDADLAKLLAKILDGKDESND